MMTPSDVFVHNLLSTIIPMLAISDPSMPLINLQPDWIFDTKLDGIRALAAWDGNTLLLRNRNGRIMDNYVDLEMTVVDIPSPVILDGEIVTVSGKFQDVAWRDKQRGAKATNGMLQQPVYFKAFDILWHPEKGDVRLLPFIERRQLLMLLNLDLCGGGAWSPTEVSYDRNFYEVIQKRGGEGIVAKHIYSCYEAGRSKNWRKFKSTFTLTCVGTGYETGKGARSEFGSMHVAMLADDGASFINVGKVGSGFTLSESLEMKEYLDGDMPDGVPIVEIQCYNLTRNGKLRMPVYLGQRFDLSVEDTTVKQLINIPKT